ncbi:MAG: hypothetical protein ABFS37_16890, partial [Acidobacteriota bacterium]
MKQDNNNPVKPHPGKSVATLRRFLRLQRGILQLLDKEQPMAGTGKKWLIGCGVGCGSFVVLMVLISIGGSLFMMRPFDRAVKAQKELTSEFGSRADFVPQPDGITLDRLERFLAVRRAVMASCETFEGVAERFDAMGALENSDEDPALGDVFKGVGGIMGGIFGMVGEIGKVTEVRNAALQENEMGLGEYTWIYMLAYNSWLQKAPNTGLDQTEEGSLSRVDADLIAVLVGNHVGALREAGRVEEADLWQAELDRFDRIELPLP